MESKASKVQAFSDISKAIQIQLKAVLRNLLWIVLILFPPQTFTRQSCCNVHDRELKGTKMGFPPVAWCFYQVS